MNSTINKTFYTCSTESMFLRYKKISKKALKIGGFLQCWIHIFLGHDGCFWKIDLRILWNNVMKNFQVKHGQCESIIFPKTLTDFFIFYGNQVLLGFMSQCGPASCPSKNSKKGLSLLSSLAKKRIYLESQLKWELNDLFGNCQSVSYFHRESRNRMMNTFIIVNITPTWKG